MDGVLRVRLGERGLRTEGRATGRSRERPERRIDRARRRCEGKGSAERGDDATCEDERRERGRSGARCPAELERRGLDERETDSHAGDGVER
jgi:hypothetical protein